jgi:hypothetical protein
MSDMDHRELDEDAPEFERQGLKPKPRSEPEAEPEPDPARPRAKTSSGEANEP